VQYIGPTGHSDAESVSDQPDSMTHDRGAATTERPPDGLPRYRLLTGPDDADFCHKVSQALDMGYRLHGSPAITFNGTHPVVAQAVVWPDASRPDQTTR
jgi:hypothetical protein